MNELLPLDITDAGFGVVPRHQRGRYALPQGEQHLALVSGLVGVCLAGAVAPEHFLVNGVLVRLHRDGQFLNQRPCVVVRVEASGDDAPFDGECNLLIAERVPQLLAALSGRDGQHAFSGAGERPVFQLAVHSVAHFSWYTCIRSTARSQSKKSEMTGKMLGASSRKYVSGHTSRPLLAM